jgi:hypothetical protein
MGQEQLCIQSKITHHPRFHELARIVGHQVEVRSSTPSEASVTIIHQKTPSLLSTFFGKASDVDFYSAHS